MISIRAQTLRNPSAGEHHRLARRLTRDSSQQFSGDLSISLLICDRTSMSRRAVCNFVLCNCHFLEDSNRSLLCLCRAQWR